MLQQLMTSTWYIFVYFLRRNGRGLDRCSEIREWICVMCFFEGKSGTGLKRGCRRIKSFIASRRQSFMSFLFILILSNVLMLLNDVIIQRACVGRWYMFAHSHVYFICEEWWRWCKEEKPYAEPPSLLSCFFCGSFEFIMSFFLCLLPLLCMEVVDSSNALESMGSGTNCWLQTSSSCVKSLPGVMVDLL